MTENDSFLRAMLVAGAFALSMPGQPAAASGTGFEMDPVGTTDPLFIPADPGFGGFTGGRVEAPGDTIDAQFTLAGAHVYAGTELFYTNILPGPSHCCGYFRMEMRLATLGPVRIDLYGHAPGAPDLFTETLMASEIVEGIDISFGWGVPLEPTEDGSGPGPYGNSDITSIRWTSLDGQAFALDDVMGVGTPAIPEPATWGLLILGFGLVGTRIRWRGAVLA